MQLCSVICCCFQFLLAVVQGAYQSHNILRSAKACFHEPVVLSGVCVLDLLSQGS